MQADKASFKLITGVINKKGFIHLPAEGTSMFPFICRGDVCCFAAFEPKSLEKGDVVLFRTLSGRLVAHRYYAAVTQGNETKYLIKGDTNLGFDEPIGRDQIIGRLVSIQKKKRTIHSAHFTAKLWRFIILTFPVTSSLLRRFLNRKGHSKAAS